MGSCVTTWVSARRCSPSAFWQAITTSGTNSTVTEMEYVLKYIICLNSAMLLYAVIVRGLISVSCFTPIFNVV